MTTAYDFSATSASGNNVDLSDYAGRVLLIVNTASKCGFTPQYEGLEELQAQFKDRGFDCLLYTSPSPRDVEESRMPSSA